MKSVREFLDALRSLDPRTRQRLIVAVGVVALLAAAYVSLLGATRALARKRVSREADLAEMMRLRQQVSAAKMQAQRQANRMATLRPDDSPARIIEETGVAGKNLQVRPVKTEAAGGAAEDAAEVKMEGLTLNDVVNLLYRLESGAKPVVLRKAQLRTRFDAPDRIDVALTMSLAKAAAPGPAK